MRTLFLAICLSAIPGLGADTYTFSVSQAENVIGIGIPTLTGWGYNLQNQSNSDWLVTTDLNAGTFLYATPQLLFDFPDLAPGASVNLPYDPLTPAGLYQIAWDPNAPADFVNSGRFTLTAQWWSGNPLAGGTFVADAPSMSGAYRATPTITAVPEPSTLGLTALVVLGLLPAAARRRNSASLFIRSVETGPEASGRTEIKTILARRMFGFPLWLALTLSTVAGQSVAKQHSASPPQCSPSKGNDTKSAVDEPVGIVAGQPIYERDLDDLVASQILPLRNQEYQVKSKGLEDLIRQRLVEAEAKKQGITTDQLYAKEVDSKIATPSDGEVAAYYLGLKSQIKTPLQEIKKQLQANLKAIETRQARQEYADSLRAKADVTVLLNQPRVQVAFDRGRLRGDPNAVITIVEFADFQCPYCKQTETTLNDLRRKYPGQVKLAFRDLPLGSIHPYAEKAAEAARCAGKQGRFWEFHDALFANQAKLDEPGLNAIAQTLALDENSFQSCLASGEYKAQVSLDQEDGRKAGISSTPGFFINGIAVTGAQPETAFEKIIDDELRAARNQPVVRASR